MIKLDEIEEIKVSFPMDGWDQSNPHENRAGYFYDPEGNRHTIHLNDPEVIKLADEQKVDAIFQFDTQLAKSILANGVRNFEDLMLFSGLGHPGPMQCIPEAVANRDDPTGSWKKKLYDLHPTFLEILEPTYGVICFQEDTLISLADGRHIPIKDIEPGILVHSPNLTTGVVDIKQVESCGPTKFGDGLKITLYNGYSITITHNHKLCLWDNEQKEAKDLEIGDLVAVPLSHDEFICHIKFGDFRYFKITKIEPVFNQQFYNLSVEDNHTVVANGIASHQCYQEQLQALWQRIAGFTAPEAQDARKAVAKKWAEKLKPIKNKWITGATPLIGEEEANNWWDKMETFGRYAFNKCLSKNTLLKDTKTGLTQTIEQWYYHKNSEYPKFKSYKNGKIIEDTCIDIQQNEEMDIFEIEFEDGTKEQLTLDHKLLCEDNQYHEVREIIEQKLDVTRIRINN